MYEQFFRHLLKAYNQKSERNVKKKNVIKQVEKVKTFSEKKPSKKALDKQFEVLEEQIEDAIDTEKAILKKFSKKDFNKKVLHKIVTLEKQLENYTKAIEGRQKRIIHIEKKIREHKEPKKIVPAEKPIKTIVQSPKDEIKNQLLKLEGLYHDLKAEGVPASQLKRVKEKIKELKKKI